MKVIEEMYSNYLNGGYSDIVTPFQLGEKRKEFAKLWDKLNKSLTPEEQNQNCIVLRDTNYETDLISSF